MTALERGDLVRTYRCSSVWECVRVYSASLAAVVAVRQPDLSVT